MIFPVQQMQVLTLICIGGIECARISIQNQYGGIQRSDSLESFYNNQMNDMVQFIIVIVWVCVF